MKAWVWLRLPRYEYAGIQGTFEVNDLRLSGVSIPGNKPYNEGMYALLLDLSNGDMSKSQFDNWYSMLLGLQGAKYDLLGILVKKCQVGQLSVNNLKAEYTRLSAIASWGRKEIAQQLISFRKRDLIHTKDFVSHYSLMIDSPTDIQKILERKALDAYEVGRISIDHFKEWSDQYVDVNFHNYNPNVEKVFVYMFERGLINWEQKGILTYMSQNSQTIEMSLSLAIQMLHQNKMSLSEFKTIVPRFAKNLPGWFSQLCDLGVRLGKENKTVNVDKLSAEDLGVVKEFVKNFYSFYFKPGDVDAVNTVRATNFFKDFYNYYYDGANLTVDGSVNYTVLSKMALVYLDQLRVTRSSEMPYWYRIFAVWKKNIENQTDHEMVFEKGKRPKSLKIWALQHILNMCMSEGDKLGKSTQDDADGKTRLKLYDYKETNKLLAAGETNKVALDIKTIESLLKASEKYAMEQRLAGKFVIEALDPAVESANFQVLWPLQAEKKDGTIGELPKYRVTSTHSWRNWGGIKKHDGIDVGRLLDIPEIVKIPIRTIGAGDVLSSYNSTSAGEMVVIGHEDKIIVRYMHMEHRSRVVFNGNKVLKDQKIGIMGGTPSFGIHLHYEIRMGHNIDKWKFYKTIDPLLCVPLDKCYIFDIYLGEVLK